MSVPKLTDSDIREELRKLVFSARKRFRADIEDTVALIEAQANIYTEQQQDRAPKVIAELKVKVDAADALYDQLVKFIDRN